ncbi:hypothetical protein [Methylobacterium sp. J-077]|uniref:hypothetical protein n=1 Tax=Methylobacterium sp. J-077 TaxID=2836656 RepID=UPI001FBA05C3|nr:hypothetical protein [Methylobacterium sp. J-077]MCJ2126658.1 hypothetical protein [Methylobacterium sp. J-077]
MRPEPLAVGLGVMVFAVAAVRLLHGAGYHYAGVMILLTGLLVGGLITVLGRARAN